VRLIPLKHYVKSREVTVSRARFHVLAELNVADALGDEALSAAELARTVGADADALFRVLRLACAHGVFDQEGDRFRHSPASRMLRSDHPQSMRAFVRMFGLAINWDAYRELEYSVRSGHRATERTLPEGVWSYLRQHEEANNIFNATMLAKARGQIPAIITCCDFSRFELIGDIAGGRGHLLSAILDAAPKTKGILFDLPHVVKEASDLASSRLTLQSGDFFPDALPKCDAYILMEIIHDWPDKESVAILKAVRQAAPTGATLFLIEAIVRASSEPDWRQPPTTPVGLASTSSLHEALQRIGQRLERRDSDFGTVMELRENIQTDILMRIGHHSRYGGDLFLGERVHDLSDVTRGGGIHRL
jgi:O-methyltransferase domain